MGPELDMDAINAAVNATAGDDPNLQTTFDVNAISLDDVPMSNDELQHRLREDPNMSLSGGQSAAARPQVTQAVDYTQKATPTGVPNPVLVSNPAATPATGTPATTPAQTATPAQAPATTTENDLPSSADGSYDTGNMSLTFSAKKDQNGTDITVESSEEVNENTKKLAENTAKIQDNARKMFETYKPKDDKMKIVYVAVGAGVILLAIILIVALAM